MALLYCPRFQALDENGDPISGAQLWTYDSVATTTPKATYTDNTLTVALSNPVVADANGVFPQIFGEADEAYYCVLQDADDETIDEFFNLQMLGSDDTSVWLRNFGLNGRLRSYGGGGTVHLEFMPAAGDDVGGVGRIGGAEETQGDTLEVDFATTTVTGDLTVTGNLTFGSLDDVSEAYPRLLASGSASAAATTNIALPASFDRYQLEIFNLYTSGSGGLRLRFSFDDGATFKDGAADYIAQGYYQGNAGFNNVAVSTAAYITLMFGSDTDVDANRAILDIRSQAGHESHVESRHTSLDSSATNSRSGVYTGATNSKGYGKATHLQIISGSGTATFDYKLMGHP